MEKKKSKIGCLIKFFLIFFLIISVVFIGTYIFYRMTKEEVKKYIPADYTGYIKIDSLLDTYNSLIELRASDIILSKTELKDIYKTILDLRSTSIFKNKFLIRLLNIKVNIVFKKDYFPILLLDLGYKSILIRSSQILTRFLGGHKNFTLENIKNEDKYNIYRLYLKSYNQILYISVCKNLLFIGFILMIITFYCKIYFIVYMSFFMFVIGLFVNFLNALKPKYQYKIIKKLKLKNIIKKI